MPVEDIPMFTSKPARVPIAHLNSLIMDYLVVEGFKETAEEFSKESGVTPAQEMDTLNTRFQIRQAIRSGQILDAITLANEMHPEVLESDQTIRFQLYKLHLIELIRKGNIAEAMTFAQVQLAEAGEKNVEVLAELERTMALMVYENPENSPFADLLQTAHRQKVASQLNEAILVVEKDKQTRPKLVSSLQLIVWAQAELDKKNVVYHKMIDFTSDNSDYPKY